MEARSFEVLAHTADTGIATTGATLGDVIANAAYGMFALMYDIGGARPAGDVTFELHADSPAELLVDVLAELLYRSEADDVAFVQIGVDVARLHASSVAGAVPANTLEVRGPPIKAVTYHDLRCEPVADHWEARVIFDV